MTEYYLESVGQLIGFREPGCQMVRLAADGPVFAEIEPKIGTTKTHARKTVDDKPQSIVTIEISRPQVGSVAVHGVKIIGVVIAAQYAVHFPGPLFCRLQRPARIDARVHHHVVERCIVVDQRLLPQPVQ